MAAYLRLVTEDYNKITVDPLHIQGFIFAEFLSDMTDDNIVADLAKKNVKDVRQYTTSVAALLRDVYLLSPKIGFQMYGIPFSYPRWQLYVRSKFRIYCSRCNEPVIFNLWSAKEFAASQQVMGEFNDLYTYYKFLINSNNSKIPWCRPCVTKGVMNLVGDHTKDKDFWQLLEVRIWDELAAHLKTATFKETPEIKEAVGRLIREVPYQYIHYTIKKVIENTLLNIECKKWGKCKAQSILAHYLIHYGRNCFERNYKVSEKQIPFNRNTMIELIGVTPEGFETKPLADFINL